jgi:hypothetical protein
MRDTALDRQPRHRQLFDMSAAGAKQFAPDRADHLERGGDPRELLRYVLAQRLHGRRAPGAERIRFEDDLLARQVRRERLSRRRFAGRRIRRPVSLVTRLGSTPTARQVLQLRLEPVDLLRELFGLAPEVHSPELVDLRLQALDLVISRDEFLPHLRDRCLLREHHGMELGDGIRKRRVIGHASQFTSLRRGLQHRQCGGASWLSPVDTLEQH